MSRAIPQDVVDALAPHLYEGEPLLWGSSRVVDQRRLVLIGATFGALGLVMVTLAAWFALSLGDGNVYAWDISFGPRRAKAFALIVMAIGMWIALPAWITAMAAVRAPRTVETYGLTDRRLILAEANPSREFVREVTPNERAIIRADDGQSGAVRFFTSEEARRPSVVFCGVDHPSDTAELIKRTLARIDHSEQQTA